MDGTLVDTEPYWMTAEKEMDTALKTREADLKDFKKELSTTNQQVLNLEEKFLLNQINADTYKRWSSKYTATISHLEYSIDACKGNVSSTWARFKTELPKLTNIRGLYNSASIFQKQSLVKAWFNSQLRYEDGIYRTTFLLPLFAHNSLVLKEKGLLEVEQPFENGAENGISTRDGS